MNTKENATELEKLSHDFNKVASKLKQVVTGIEEDGHDVILNMGLGDTQQYVYECHTVACLAGFYAMTDSNSSFICHGDGINVLQNANWTSDHSYKAGGTLFAKDLGFNEQWELEQWAGLHPLLWGNTKGRKLMMYASAWGDGEVTINTIINHLMAVSERCKTESAKMKTITT